MRRVVNKAEGEGGVVIDGGKENESIIYRANIHLES